MKILIFAGGTGRRLWPISRKKSPKQFEPIIGPKSTVQLAVDRFAGLVPSNDILVSTNEAYLDILRSQLPDLPPSNFIGEPVRRDLAAAVGLALIHLRNAGAADEPVAIVWGDNYMTRQSAFISLLKSAEGILESRKAEIVYVGETARFANNNLGWIGFGSEIGRVLDNAYYAYESWIYRPDLDECRRMFRSGQYVWNTGYFVTRPDYVLSAYERLEPEMWQRLRTIEDAIDYPNYVDVLQSEYPLLKQSSFDDAIVRHLPREEAVVVHGDTGWSDPGTLYALKEAINPDPHANVVLGLVKSIDTSDSLLYNYEEGKLLAAVGLEGMVVVNTEDAVLIVHKDDISLVKELVNQLSGSDLEDFS